MRPRVRNAARVLERGGRPLGLSAVTAPAGMLQVERRHTGARTGVRRYGGEANLQRLQVDHEVSDPEFPIQGK